MNNESMGHIKGILATLTSIVSSVLVWTDIEMYLRMGVSIGGIIASVVAARYWHKRTKMLDKQMSLVKKVDDKLDDL